MAENTARQLDNDLPDLEAYWMPFTGNRQFKEEPRFIVGADGCRFRTADGREVTTIEGLSPSSGLSPVQAAFKEHHGLQCGFCTPGFVATISAAVPDEYPGNDGIRELLSGNLCRCTGYEGIVDAVRSIWGRDT